MRAAGSRSATVSTAMSHQGGPVLPIWLSKVARGGGVMQAAGSRSATVSIAMSRQGGAVLPSLAIASLPEAATGQHSHVTPRRGCFAKLGICKFARGRHRSAQPCHAKEALFWQAWHL